MGHVLNLEVSDDIYNSLAEKARQSGQTAEALAAQLLTAATQELADDPLEQFIGAFNSQGINWADQHDKYLGDLVMETLKSGVSDSRSDG